jgi:glycosyltransferase involved in cell wall biosynthesis
MAPEKTRVLIVTQALEQGGLEEVVRLYALHLNKQRYDVTVAYVVGGDLSRQMANIEDIELVCFHHPNHLKRLLRLTSLAREKRVQVLHNHLNWYGLLAGFLSGAKSVETIHNTYHWFGARKRWMFALSTLLAHRLIAVSRSVLQYTVESFPLMTTRKFVVIHNSIDTDRFTPPPNREMARRALGVKSGELVLGFVGRLEKQKAVHRLLEATRELERRQLRVNLILAGDGALKNQLMDQASSLGLSAVTFLGFCDDTAPLYAAFDVFVLPSDYEGLPLTVLEAMSSGCPVVATNVGGVAEAVEHGKTGLIIPRGDTDRLIGALDLILRDASLRSQMGEAGRKKVVEEFSIGSMIGKTEALYEEILR